MASTVEEIAKVAHEVNRAYCNAIGDASQPAWQDAPEWQRNSAISGVHAHIANHLSPRESHESWLAHKRSDGWIYGDVKDTDKKTHPCMVEYDELPKEQRVKDYLFAAVVASMTSER